MIRKSVPIPRSAYDQSFGLALSAIRMLLRPHSLDRSVDRPSCYRYRVRNV